MEQDYKKLRGVISYLEDTVHLLLVIGVDNKGTLTWNIDASFTVHSDCKSHTGACLTLRHGSVISLSKKQKINDKSSTEAELVGVDDAMTFVMWIRGHNLNGVHHAQVSIFAMIVPKIKSGLKFILRKHKPLLITNNKCSFIQLNHL